MDNIVDVEPTEAKKWLKHNLDWEFKGEVNQITHQDILRFVIDLYDAGCKLVEMFVYEWTLEPAYEGDNYQPDILLISLPDDKGRREKVFDILNTRFDNLVAKHNYKDNRSGKVMYFFEPEAHEIILGTKKITWYT